MLKKILLHCCCAPCATWAVTSLTSLYPDAKIDCFYFNPNIMPLEEYNKRGQEMIKLGKYFSVNVFISDYDNDEYLRQISGLENEREGGKRCEKCFELRLKGAAQYAKQNDYDVFCSSLSVSPHKNAQLINSIGENIASCQGIKYLPTNFKKQNGYLNSINLSKELGLYRQSYCGCKFALSVHKAF